MDKKRLVEGFKAPQKPDQKTSLELSAIKRKHRERFRRRRNNLMYNGFKFSKDCDAKVYIVVSKNGKNYSFKNKKDASWPPNEEELVRPCLHILFPKLIIKGSHSRRREKKDVCKLCYQIQG
jgi:hypothetical protein